MNSPLLTVKVFKEETSQNMENKPKNGKVSIQ